MKRHSTYLTRALTARDPRYATILTKLGHMPAAASAAPRHVQPIDDIAALRAEYQAVVGKRPFMGWGADVLREKIAAAKV